MEDKELQEERNRRDALELAKGIYEVVNDPKFRDNFTPEERHSVILKKYPNFAQAFPVVLRYIAKELRYNENAFKKFLDKLKADPGKGMDGFMQRQADYAKFLYLEDCKLKGIHWNMKTANQIWNLEYENMSKTAKKLEKQEKEARSEFEELEKKNLLLKKQELLNFINTEDPFTNKEPEKQEVDPEILDINNVIIMVRNAKDRRLGLIEELNDRQSVIAEIAEKLNRPVPEKYQVPENDVYNKIIKDLSKPELVSMLKTINKDITELEKIVETVVNTVNSMDKEWRRREHEKNVAESWKEHVTGILNPVKKDKKKQDTRKKERKEGKDKNKEKEEIERLANWINQ